MAKWGKKIQQSDVFNWHKRKISSFSFLNTFMFNRLILEIHIFISLGQKLNISQYDKLLLYNKHMFPIHIIAFITSVHTLLSPPSAIFFTSPGDDRRGPVSDLEAVGRERERGRESWSRTSSITLCFSLQSRAARRLTHSLWDTLNNSQSGKCGWIPNENRSSLCFINCCHYQHFQIAHIPLTNRQPCRCFGGWKRRKMLHCHCSSVTVHFSAMDVGFFPIGAIYCKLRTYMFRSLMVVSMHQNELCVCECVWGAVLENLHFLPFCTSAAVQLRGKYFTIYSYNLTAFIMSYFKN